jgi:CelD/BcsL family acetyltransferase involved in cellulose biosynthesis
MTTLDRAPSLEFLTTDADLAALGPEWDELLADADGASIFLTHAWIASWRATVGTDTELLIGTAREPSSGMLVGIAPLVVASRSIGPMSTRILRMAGSGIASSDHLDVIVRHGHPHVAAALWKGVSQQRTWDLIDLDGLRPGSHLSRLLVRRRGDHDAFVTETLCPVLELPESWEEYEASLGSNLRQNLRRYARKLDKDTDGPVVERLVVDADEIVETVEQLACFHQAIRTSKGQRGSFAESAMVDFHREVALRFAEKGRLRLHRLDVDGEMAAAISCFRHDDTVSFYTTGYDASLSAYGPGRRIMAASIRSAIEEGARRFDFLRGDEPYKSSWGAVEAFNDRIRMPVGPRGRTLDQVVSVVRGARDGLRRLLGR